MGKKISRRKKIQPKVEFKGLNPSTTGFKISGGPTSWAGKSVSTVDLNNDEYTDIIIGAPNQNSDQGAVYVIYGGSKSSLSNIDLSATTLTPLTTGFVITGNGGSFGSSVSSAGDINNDGYNDLVIGAPETNTGAAYVIYGGSKASMSNIDLSSSTLDPSTNGFMVTGKEQDSDFGNQVASAGDINNDGYDDIIIGAQGSTQVKGTVSVIYGGLKSSMSNIDLSSSTLDPSTTGFTMTGASATDLFGCSVSSSGDINQDGYDDIIIGAKSYGDQISRIGAAYVVYGGSKSSMSNIDISTTTLDPLTTGFSIFGSSQGDQVGTSVSSADINNDGNSDLIIGAFGSTNTGNVYLFLSQCPKNCEKCSVATSCEVCSSSYILFSNQCVANCPNKMFDSNGKCQSCPSGCSTCTSSSTCQSCIYGYRLRESQLCTKQIETTSVEEIEEKDVEKAAAGAFEGTVLVGAALGSGSSIPLNFGLAAKILRNIKYMEISVSDELQEAFVSWKVPSEWAGAPKSWSSKYSGKTLPTTFSQYGLESAFLINFWKPLILALIGVVVFAVSKLIQVKIKNKKGRMYNVLKQVNIAGSNFALIQFYGNLDDVIFYFILEVRSTKFETAFRICSSVVAIVLLFVGVVFLALHLKIIAKYQKAKKSKRVEGFVAKFENLSLVFKDYKDKNFVIQSFLVVNIVRSVISSIIFATLFEHPLIQSSVLLALSILIIVYLCWKRNFKERINTLGQIFCEVALLFAYICVFILVLSDHMGSDPIISTDALSKCILIINFVLLFGCAILLVISLGKMLYKSYSEGRKTKQVLPQEKKKDIFASAKVGPGLDPSDLRFSTESALVDHSQSSLPSDSHRNPLKAGPDESDLNITNQQDNSNNYFIRKRRNMKNLKGGIDISSSNIEDIEEGSQSNRPLHTQPRGRALTRIAQGSKMKETLKNKSPESKTQDPSLHSQMIVHQDSVVAKEDVPLTKLKVIQDY